MMAVKYYEMAFISFCALLTWYQMTNNSKAKINFQMFLLNVVFFGFIGFSFLVIYKYLF